MRELNEELFLIQDRVDRSFAQDSGFGHLFHGVELALLPLFDLPDFAEATPTNYVVKMEL